MLAPVVAAPPDRMDFDCTYEFVSLLDPDTVWGAGGQGGGSYHVRDSVALWRSLEGGDAVCSGDAIFDADADYGAGVGLWPQGAGVIKVDIYLVLDTYEGGFDITGTDHDGYGRFVGAGFGDFAGWQLRATGWRRSEPPQELASLTGHIFLPRS